MAIRAKDRTYQRRLGQVLSRHVGLGKAMPVNDLAHGAGCSPKMIYALQRGDMAVSVSRELFCAILQKMPEEAMEEFMNGLGYAGARRLDNRPACFRKLHSMLARLSHKLAQAYEDDRLDHREEVELRAEIRPLQSFLSRFVKVQS